LPRSRQREVNTPGWYTERPGGRACDRFGYFFCCPGRAEINGPYLVIVMLNPFLNGFK
jgi:hypothetical protein